MTKIGWSKYKNHVCDFFFPTFQYSANGLWKAKISISSPRDRTATLNVKGEYILKAFHPRVKRSKH